LFRLWSIQFSNSLKITLEFPMYIFIYINTVCFIIDSTLYISVYVVCLSVGLLRTLVKIIFSHLILHDKLNMLPYISLASFIYFLDYITFLDISSCNQSFILVDVFSFKNDFPRDWIHFSFLVSIFSTRFWWLMHDIAITAWWYIWSYWIR
jgi:hypothetical protein